MRREPAWIAIVRPPVAAIGFILKVLDRALLRWWLVPLLERVDDKRLVEDVKQQVPLLFADSVGGVVIPTKTRLPRSFDLAVVTVSTPNFLIRFTRVRDELNVRVASVTPPQKWEDLSVVIKDSEYQEETGSNGIVKKRASLAYYSLADVEQLLMTHLPALQNYWIKY